MLAKLSSAESTFLTLLISFLKPSLGFEWFLNPYEGSTKASEIEKRQPLLGSSQQSCEDFCGKSVTAEESNLRE